jgi:hypothetical protein
MGSPRRRPQCTEQLARRNRDSDLDLSGKPAHKTVSVLDIGGLGSGPAVRCVHEVAIALELPADVAKSAPPTIASGALRVLFTASPIRPERACAASGASAPATAGATEPPRSSPSRVTKATAPPGANPGAKAMERCGTWWNAVDVYTRPGLTLWTFVEGSDLGEAQVIVVAGHLRNGTPGASRSPHSPRPAGRPTSYWY